MLLDYTETLRKNGTCLLENKNFPSLNQMGNNCLVFAKNCVFCHKISRSAEERKEVSNIIS